MSAGKLQVGSGLFELPSNIPHYMTLGRIGRGILGGEESADVITPWKSYHLNSGDRPSVTNGSLQLTLDGSLRIIGRGHQPGQLVNGFANELSLVALRSERWVSKGEVERFVEAVSDNPKAYSGSFIHAQLDLWGRPALRHLRRIDYSNLVEYAAYMIRYIERMHPRVGAELMEAGASYSTVVRFSRKPLVEGGFVGRSGWPLEGCLPDQAEALLRSGVKLSADWMKDEFVERIVHGLRGGGIFVTDPYGGGRFSINTVKGYRALFDIARGDSVGVESLFGPMSRGTLEMFMRATGLLVGKRFDAGALKSSKTAWWRFKSDPFDFESDVVDALRSYLVGSDRAVRVFSPHHWMRMQSGMPVRMAYDGAISRGDVVCGVIAEGTDGRHASALLKGMKYALRDLGECVDEGAMVQQFMRQQPPFFRRGWPFVNKLEAVVGARVFLRSPFDLGEQGRDNAVIADVLGRHPEANISFGSEVSPAGMEWHPLRRQDGEQLPLVSTSQRMGINLFLNPHRIQGWRLFLDMIRAFGVDRLVPRLKPRSLRPIRMCLRSELPAVFIEQLVRNIGSPDLMLRMTSESAWHLFTPQAHVELVYPGHGDERYSVWEIRASGEGAEEVIRHSSLFKITP